MYLLLSTVYDGIFTMYYTSGDIMTCLYHFQGLESVVQALADRRSEHVACAGGRPVRSAGEMFFASNGDGQAFLFRRCLTCRQLNLV